MSNGYFSIQGYQTETSSIGRTNLGPFNVSFSAVTQIDSMSLSAGTAVVPVPTGSFGVAVIPPIGAPPAGITLKFKTVSGDTGTFISTEQPTVVEWDVVNNEVPTDVYLVVAGSGSIEVVVQFL